MAIGANRAAVLGAAGGGGGVYEADPYYSNTLVWFDAREGLVDNGPKGLTISKSGAFASEGPDYWDSNNSGYFQFNGDADFNFGTTDSFTFEFIADLQTSSHSDTFLTMTANLIWYPDDIYIDAIGHDYHTTVATGLAHYRIVRSGSTIYACRAGSSYRSRYHGQTVNASGGPHQVGSQGSGNIADWHIYAWRILDVALPTSYTPSTDNYFDV